MAFRLTLRLAALTMTPLLMGQTPIGTIIAEQSRTAFTVEGAGARAMGLGGAFIAIADDATAVSYNPAGLAQLLQPEVSVVGRGLRRSVGYQDFETVSARRQLAVSDALASSTRFDPLFLSGTVPIQVAGRNLVLQASIQRAFALGEHDDRELQETPVASGSGLPSHLSQSLNQSGQIDLYALAAAYELSQRVLLGVSFQQWRGRWDLATYSHRVSPVRDATVSFRQGNRLDGQNLNLGLIWRWPSWSLGLVHRTGFHAEYTFDSTLASNVAGLNATVAPTTVGLHWPASDGLGFAYRPREHWLVTADLTHTLWSTAKYMTPNAALDGLGFFDYDRGGRTPNATTAHLGAEYLWITAADSVVPLRLGLSREPQPVVDRLTGEQRVMYRAGIGSGFKRGATGFDVAYRYGWARRQASQFLEVDQLVSRMPPTSTGNERIREHRLDFSFIYKFEREPLDRALRYLFVGD